MRSPSATRGPPASVVLPFAGKELLCGRGAGEPIEGFTVDLEKREASTESLKEVGGILPVAEKVERRAQRLHRVELAEATKVLRVGRQEERQPPSNGGRPVAREAQRESTPLSQAIPRAVDGQDASAPGRCQVRARERRRCMGVEEDRRRPEALGPVDAASAAEAEEPEAGARPGVIVADDP